MARKQDRMEGYARQHRAHRRWGLLVRTSAVAVALCTVSALVLPALTMEAEKAAYCGNQAHTHSAECYTKKTVCGLEEVTQPALVCTVEEGHTHTDACREKTLICTVAEGHPHAPECYQTVEELTCTLAEDETHTHTEGCYARHEELVCTQPEGHVHTEECYQQDLVCTVPENHTHTDGCYAPVPSDAHTHTEECYQQELTCPLPEHTHTLACYSDPTADKEASADWEATLPAEKTGVWAWDLVAAAQSQLGYAESEKNYEVQPDGVTTLGYTRYGDWYGIPYGDWCAMFVSFCLNYAGVPRESMPIESSVPRWVEMLAQQGQLYTLADRDPRPGDLMFVDGDGDEAPEHMGIVEEFGENLIVIEGNTSSNVVERVTYRRDTDLAMAFAPCPVNPEDLTTASFEGEDFSVQAVYSSEAKIPADAQLRASEYPSDSETYRRRVEQMQEQYGLTPEEAEEIRLFNIGFYQGDAEVEPSAPVHVTLTYADNARDVGCSVAHFGEELEQVPADATVANGMRTLRFTLGSFSDVAVMPLLTDTELSQGYFALVSAVENNGGSHSVLTSSFNSAPAVKGSFQPTQSAGSFPDHVVTLGTTADVAQFEKDYIIWHFENVNNGKCKIHFLDAGKKPHYIQVVNNSTLTTTAQGDGTEFTITRVPNTNYITLSYTEREWFWEVTYYIYSTGNGFGVTRQQSQNTHFYLVSGAKTVNTVKGETPAGTVINLFDYWRNNQDEGTYVNNELNSGINQNHALKFTGAGQANEIGAANEWTRSGGGVRQNIVAKKLDDKGYPQLSGDPNLFFSNLGDTQESLAYLFDPDANTPNRAVYPNVGNLLQVDSEGYFYYDCTKNYAYYDPDIKQFTLYDAPFSGTQNGPEGQFYPFKPFGQNKESFYFGMTLTTRFINRYGGHTDPNRQKDMTFEFSGDDDVWIFIDGVLVADLGGIHDAASVDINFANGTVAIDKVGVGNNTKGQTRYFRDIFTADTGVALDGNKLKDGTYHTLKFFYLERGAGSSNMHLKYNLASIPTTGVYKTSQRGKPVVGAKFAVYPANENYQYLGGDGNPVELPKTVRYDANGNILDAEGKNVLVPTVYTGVTGSKGDMIFRDSFGGALAITEMEAMFGTHFILREYQVPVGFRMVEDEVRLYIDDKVLLTNEPYDSGVYNAVTELLEAPSDIYLIERGEHRKYGKAEDHLETDGASGTTYGKVNYYSADATKPKVNGTLFAVVQKFAVGDNATWEHMKEDKNWNPIWGSGAEGYHSIDPKDAQPESLIAAAIEAAQKQQKVVFGDGAVFTQAASGAMELDMQNLPGEPQDYYWYLSQNSTVHDDIPKKTRFTVALYWTEADSLDGAKVDNTWQVNSDALKFTDGTTSPEFHRAFGANIEVPNIVNRMMLQKLDRDGNGVNGATFALYPAFTQNNVLYYKSEEDQNIVLNDDGTARLLGDTASSGTYTIDPGSGVIEVKIGNGTYIIRPQTAFDGKTSIIEDTKPNSNVSLSDKNGILELVAMPLGNFVLREIKAPEGYLINPAQIMVKVDEHGVYLNAGTKNDDVSVSIGPGYLISSMQHMASAGEIDRTLYWIYSVLKVNTDDVNSFDISTQFTSGEDHWQYLKETGEPFHAKDVTQAIKEGALRNYMEYFTADKDTQNQNYQIHGHVYDDLKPGMEKSMLLTAEEGWTGLVVRQDYEHGILHKTGQVAGEAAGEYEYVDLKQKSISKLFSLAKLVQVKDQRTSSLSIEKQVLPPEKADSSPAFTFNIELKTMDGAVVNDTFPMTITKANGATEEKSIPFTKGEAKVSLRHGEKVLISELPEKAKYTVTEVENASYATTVQVDQDPAIANNTATGQLAWVPADPNVEGSVPDYTTELLFTNTYQTTITLVKHAMGAPETRLPGAKFTLQDDATKHYYQANGGFAEQKYEVVTDGNGEFKFVNLADGTYILTETKAPDGYARLTHPVTITVKDAKITSVADGTQTHYEFENTVLYLPNSAGMVLPQTGGVGTTGITTLGLGLLILAGAILLVQKRKGAVSKS